MLENDYIMRMIMDLVRSIRKVYNLPGVDKDEALDDIEGSVAKAVNIDKDLLFSLSPESMVQLVSMGEMTDDLASNITSAMFIESKLLEAEGKLDVASLRRQQAIALAREYGCDIPDSAKSAEGLMREFLEEDGSMEDSASVEPGKGDDDDDGPLGLTAEGTTISGIPIDKLKFDD